MAADDGRIRLSGTIRQSERGDRRTAGGFGKLIEDNRAVFRKYFGVELFAGSLNIDVSEPAALQEDLDQGKHQPEFVIPKAELFGMPGYIGDAQAWRAALVTQKSSTPIVCWIFRRIGSRVPRGVIEVLAAEKLTTRYGFVHGEAVELTLFEGSLSVTD